MTSKPALEPAAQQFADATADRGFSEIWAASRRKMPVDVVAQLADASTPDEVRSVLGRELGTTDRAAVPIGNDQPEDANQQTRETTTKERTKSRMSNLANQPSNVDSGTWMRWEASQSPVLGQLYVGRPVRRAAPKDTVRRVLGPGNPRGKFSTSGRPDPGQ